jgi:hypothetical protein
MYLASVFKLTNLPGVLFDPGILLPVPSLLIRRKRLSQ